MSRTSIFIIGLGAALTFPAVASASCGTTQGSYAVTCEQGVQVFRHNALSGIPAPITQAEATLQAEQIRAKTAQQRIASQERASQRDADLRNRELGIEDYRARVYNQKLNRTSRYNSSYGGRFASGNFGSGGRGYGQSVRIRTQGTQAKY